MLKYEGTGHEKFIGEREFMFDAYIDLEQVQRSEDGCDMRFRSFNHSTCKTVLNLLETVYLRPRMTNAESYSNQVWTTEAAMVLVVLESR